MIDELIIEVWDNISPYIPAKDKSSAALQYLKCLAELGYDLSEQDCSDFDKYLANALSAYNTESEDEDEGYNG